MVVEPTFLARVSEGTFDPADVEMRTFVARARGNHARFHIATQHGVDLVFHLVGGGTRVVIPRGCRELLLQEAHVGAGHFGSKRMYALLLSRVWWPRMRQDCAKMVAAC